MTGRIEATDCDLFAQVMDYANRANPYPLYARLRKTPVVRADDGLYLVSSTLRILYRVAERFHESFAEGGWNFHVIPVVPGH